MSFLKNVAVGVAESNEFAGFKTGGDNSPRARGQRLIDDGYIVLGDPYGWSSFGSAKATILCEFLGRGESEYSPYDYWNGGVGDSCNYTGPGYVEWANAAVCLVYMG